MSNPFQTWMRKHTLNDKIVLAKNAGTTVGTLRQIAGGYRTDGKVSTTPELARRIEIASKGELRRENLCVACGKCELAKIAREETE
jgi:hypothetical protein